MKAALVLLLLVTACSDRDRPSVPDREPERQRRVIEPPSRGVRALPPHAIRADGVGPYKLGATAAELLDQLPSGPRITQFMIPGVVRRDILRAEGDAILIGAEPQGKTTFVAVVRGEIARTEAGIHVGSTRDELVRSLGPALDDPDRAHDPRVFVPSSLKNARIVLAGDRITAFVIAAEPGSKESEPAESACMRPPADAEKQTFGACLSAAGELVQRNGEELAVVARDGNKLVPSVRVPGLVFAAPLRNPADGRDDLVAIAKSDDARGRTWSLFAFRLAEGKLLQFIERPAYQLSAANARWIGAELRDLELLLELESRSDSIEVGGLLTTRLADKIRDIVVISPVPIARRRARAVSHEASDAGIPDGMLPQPGPR